MSIDLQFKQHPKQSEIDSLEEVHFEAHLLFRTVQNMLNSSKFIEPDYFWLFFCLTAASLLRYDTMFIWLFCTKSYYSARYRYGPK